MTAVPAGWPNAGPSNTRAAFAKSQAGFIAADLVIDRHATRIGMNSNPGFSAREDRFANERLRRTVLRFQLPAPIRLPSPSPSIKTLAERQH